MTCPHSTEERRASIWDDDMCPVCLTARLTEAEAVRDRALRVIGWRLETLLALMHEEAGTVCRYCRGTQKVPSAQTGLPIPCVCTKPRPVR